LVCVRVFTTLSDIIPEIVGVDIGENDFVGFIVDVRDPTIDCVGLFDIEEDSVVVEETLGEGLIDNDLTGVFVFIILSDIAPETLGVNIDEDDFVGFNVDVKESKFVSVFDTSLVELIVGVEDDTIDCVGLFNVEDDSVVVEETLGKGLIDNDLTGVFVFIILSDIAPEILGVDIDEDDFVGFNVDVKESIFVSVFDTSLVELIIDVEDFSIDCDGLFDAEEDNVVVEETLDEGLIDNDLTGVFVLEGDTYDDTEDNTDDDTDDNTDDDAEDNADDDIEDNTEGDTDDNADDDTEDNTEGDTEDNPDDDIEDNAVGDAEDNAEDDTDDNAEGDTVKDSCEVLL
jgi:hypothetical protein